MLILTVDSIRALVLTVTKQHQVCRINTLQFVWEVIKESWGWNMVGGEGRGKGGFDHEQSYGKPPESAQRLQEAMTMVHWY